MVLLRQVIFPLTALWIASITAHAQLRMLDYNVNVGAIGSSSFGFRPGTCCRWLKTAARSKLVAIGDTNLDGFVDVLDAANLFTSGKYDAIASTSWVEGDLNYDEVLDILDIADFGSGGVVGGSPCGREPMASSKSRRLSSSTGWPISSRRRGSTGIACRLETSQEYSRRTTSCEKPSRRWRSGMSASGARPRPAGMGATVTAPEAAAPRIKSPARMTPPGLRGPS